MSATTGIEWTDRTWNPIRGCSPVSPGCAHCYAAAIARRFAGPGKPFEGLVTSTGKWNGQVRFLPDVLREPLKWNRKDVRVFVNSMSDLFHATLTFEQVLAIWAVMRACRRHTFQVVTKRPQLAAEVLTEAFADRLQDASDSLARDMGWCHADGDDSWPLSNVHLLTSCEDQRRADERIPQLIRCPAVVRGVSLEPLLEPIELGPWLYRGVIEAKPGDADYDALQWVIVGCESGPGRRPCEMQWILDIVRECRKARVPVFVKQVSIGGKVSKQMWEWPIEAQVRMFPGERWS
jgi:protein gp37